MVGSVAFRRPLVGWIWSLRGRPGRHPLARRPGLRRIFSWLTALWAATYLAKVVVQPGGLLRRRPPDDQKASILGIMRIALG